MTAINEKPSEVIGKGYKDFLSYKGRYRVVKGSRASKKSKTAALNIVYRMMKYPDANTLVIRKTYRTIKDSCFTELKWAVHRIGADNQWRFTESPLEATLINQNGDEQKIYFRGLDDPLKVTSITVEHGNLCWMWIEEAYEIMNEADFDMLDESIRGEVPEGLFKQITLTFNPWNERHWIKSRFFDRSDPEVLAVTTNYTCNEWLDDSDLQVFETMKKNNPRRYQVAGLGNWGVVEGTVYENWREESFTLDEIRNKYNIESAFGLDFGYTNDPTALFVGFIDMQARKIFVWDELYKNGLTNRRIYEEITEMGYGKEKITADSAEPKSIDELSALGLRTKSAKKGRDSVNNGIQFIQDFELVIHPRCVNFLTEISNYTWDKDRFGHKMNTPVDDFNHLMDAMRYALEDFIAGGATYNDTLIGGI
ncbi:MAG: PBSX family phage terminase large subunit [Bacteroidales bacterium]|nr:PBSX family phage terminase large subunit [Bacteroidales bacterium]